MGWISAPSPLAVWMPNHQPGALLPKLDLGLFGTVHVVLTAVIILPPASNCVYESHEPAGCKEREGVTRVRLHVTTYTDGGGRATNGVASTIDFSASCTCVICRSSKRKRCAYEELKLHCVEWIIGWVWSKGGRARAHDRSR